MHAHRAAFRPATERDIHAARRRQFSPPSPPGIIVAESRRRRILVSTSPHITLTARKPMASIANVETQ